MKNGLMFIVYMLSLLIQRNVSINYNGKTPPNTYIIPVVAGDVVIASATWSSASTDLDLHLFQPGRTISQANSDSCVCACCSSSQTTSLTANAAGNIVAWAQQWGGAGVNYTITVKKNGAVVETQSTFLSQNASFFKVPVSTTPCTMFVNFTSTGTFNLYFYAPGTVLTNPPVATMSYTGNSGYKDFSSLLTLTGDYQLKVVGSPANPSGGWPTITYYSGSMQCKQCSDFLIGCLTCSSSKICTSCSAAFTLVSGKCQCNLPNCQTCNTAGSQCTVCDSGYYVDLSNQCSPCSIIPLCLTCTSNTFCTLCSGANFWNNTLGQCRPCSQAFPSCIDCDNDTICLSCTADKYFNLTSLKCLSCISQMSQCLQCDINTVCQKCNTGWFVNSTNLCQTCSSAINGCTQCSSGSVCTKCNVNNILVSGACQPCSTFISQCLNCTYISPSVQCTVCSQGYFVDPTTHLCVPCNRSVNHCQFCLSQFDCIDCDWLYYLSNQTLCDTCNNTLDYCKNCTSIGDICYQCTDNRYLLQNSKCDRCLDLMNNCTKCSTNFTCIQCQIKYHINIINSASGDIKCKLCQTSMQGCQTCDSAILCTSVVNNTYFIYSTNQTTAKCYVSIPQCYKCSSQTVCVQCLVSYYLYNTSSCLSCYEAIDFCIKCSNSSICQICQQGYQPNNFGNGTGNCTCKHGWYVPRACVDMYGCVSAQRQTVLNLSISVISPLKFVCLLCDSSNHFVYDPKSYSCVCELGYTPFNDICIQRCGQGTHFIHNCDDGNIFNNDGCSYPDCNIQPGYICQGQNYQKSKCLINVRSYLNYLYTVRIDGQNKGLIYFQIYPLSDFYYRVDFNQMVWFMNRSGMTNGNGKNSKIKTNSVKYLSDGRIEIQYEFNQSCQDQMLYLNWNLGKYFYGLTNIITPFHTQPMRPPLDIIKFKELFDAVYGMGQALAFLLIILLIVGMFFHRMIAVEFVIVYQLVYSIGVMGMENMSIFRALTSLRPLLGITSILQESKIALIKPQILRFYVQSRAFLNNFNISYIVFVIVLTIFLILKLLLYKHKHTLQNYIHQSKILQAQCQKSKSKSKLQKLKSKIQQQKLLLKDHIFHSNRRAQYFYQRVLYPILTAFLCPTLIIYSVNIIGSIQGQNSMVQSISEIVCSVNFMVLLMFVGFEMRKVMTNYKDPELKITFRSLTDSLRLESRYVYPAVFLFYVISCVLTTILSISIPSLINPCLIYLLILTFFYIIYIKTSRPYKSPFHNKFLIFSTSIIFYFLVILIINSYTRTLSQMFLHILILFLFIFGYLGLIVTLYRFYIEYKQTLKQDSKDFQNGKQEKRNIKDTLPYNPFVQQENYRKNISWLADVRIFGEFKEEEKSQPEDQQKKKVHQLDRIKKRLRKEIKLLKFDSEESLAGFKNINSFNQLPPPIKNKILYLNQN